MNNENMSHLPYEIHDIGVSKIDQDSFRIIFGTKTEIEGFYEGFAEFDVGRDMLKKFIAKASGLLKN